VATIEKRPTKGGTRYRVKWRVGGGRAAKQDGETFDAYADAKRFAGLVDANGHRYPPADQLRQYGFGYLVEADSTRFTVELPEPDMPVPALPAIDKPEMPTFMAYALKYIDGLDHVEGYTRRRYRARLKHVAEHFGDTPIDQIEFEHLQAWQRAMVKKGLSAKTIQNIRGEVIIPVFKAACRPDGKKPPLIIGNPMDGLRLPPGRSKRRDIITSRKDIELYMQCAYEIDPDAGDLLMVGIATAMRWGDLAGLRVRDIDLEAAEIRPGQVLARGSEEHDRWELRSYTKSIAGDERVIPLSPGIVALLRRRMKGKRPDGLIFTAPMGGHWDHARFRERRYLKILALAQARGLAKHITPHCLRHSLLTMLADEGTDPKVMQHMAGHEHLATTYDTYIRTTKKQRATVATTVGNLIPEFSAA